jgi:tetratricopeptide (TPR) repeat protein
MKTPISGATLFVISLMVTTLELRGQYADYPEVETVPFDSSKIIVPIEAENNEFILDFVVRPNWTPITFVLALTLALLLLGFKSSPNSMRWRAAFLFPALGMIALIVGIFIQANRFSLALERGSKLCESGLYEQAALIIEEYRLRSGRESPLGYRSFCKSMPLDRLSESIAANALRAEIRNPGAVESGHFLRNDFKPANSKIRNLIVRAHSQRSKMYLDQGKIDEAYNSLIAAKSQNTSELMQKPVLENLGVINLYKSLALALRGQGKAAKEQWELYETPLTRFKVGEIAVTKGIIAREFAKEILKTSLGQHDMLPSTKNVSCDFDAIQLAKSELLSAHKFAEENDSPLSLISESLAATLILEVYHYIGDGRYMDAITSLTSLEAIAEGKIYLKDLQIIAHLGRGIELQNKQMWSDSINHLVIAKQLADPDQVTIKKIEDVLAHVHDARGHSFLLEKQYVQAVDDFEKAVGLSRREGRYVGSLTKALFAQSEAYLKDGAIARARSVLSQIPSVNPSAADKASFFLSSISDTESRLLSLNSKHQNHEFLELKVIVGELPVDTNGDNKVDHRLYYESNSDTPVYAAPVEPLQGDAKPKGIGVFDSRAEKIIATISDENGDSIFDQRVDLRSDSTIIVKRDKDYDGSPDVEAAVDEGGHILSQKPLSGVFTLGIRYGVVNMRADIFSLPDPYIAVFVNGVYLQRLPTKTNTAFPIWNKGIVTKLRHTDIVEIIAFDEDMFNPDEFIDRFAFIGIPKSGIYGFENRRFLLETDVSPSVLKAGTIVDLDGFRSDNPFLTSPESFYDYADIISGAHRVEADTEFTVAFSRSLLLAVLFRSVPNAMFRSICTSVSSETISLITSEWSGHSYNPEDFARNIAVGATVSYSLGKLLPPDLIVRALSGVVVKDAIKSKLDEVE